MLIKKILEALPLTPAPNPHGRIEYAAGAAVHTGRVRQLYGFADCSAPKEVRAFTEGFARAAVKWKSAGMRRTAG